MTDTPPRGLFGWTTPGRNIAFIAIGVLFSGMLLAAWLSGTI